MAANGHINVPFKTDGGLSHINGIAKFSSAGVVLEFESKLFGIITKGVKEVRIPLTEILDVRFRKGLFRRGAKIELRLNTFSKLTELPYRDGKLTLKLDAADYERGRAAVLNLQNTKPSRDDSGSPRGSVLKELFDDDAGDE